MSNNNNSNNWSTVNMAALGIGAAVAVGMKAYEAYTTHQQTNNTHSSSNSNYSSGIGGFADEITKLNNNLKAITKKAETLKECALCKEKVDPEAPECQKIACGHEFHRPCLVKWIKEFREVKRYCPKCRTPILSTAGC